MNFDHIKEKPWEGGAIPVSPGSLIIVRFRDGLRSKARRAGEFRWEWLEQNDDITAYRVIVDD